MAKRTNSQYVKLVSTAGTGYYYVTKINPKTAETKIEVNKYDPKIRKHVPFKETKLK